MLYASASAILYGTQPLIIRAVCNGGANGLTATFLRSILSLPILLILTKLSGEGFKLKKKTDVVALLCAGLLGSTLTTVLLYTSYSYVPIGIATTLHFIYPILVALASAAIFHQKFGKPTIISLGLGFIGISCFIGTGSNVRLVGVILALLSGACYAFYTLYMSVCGLTAYGPFQYALYVNLVVAIGTGVFGSATNQLLLNLTPAAWGGALVSAIIIGIFANGLYQMGVRHAGPVTTSILSTFEPITSVICGYLFLQEGANVIKLLGCTWILGGVVLTALDKSRARS